MGAAAGASDEVPQPAWAAPKHASAAKNAPETEEDYIEIYGSGYKMMKKMGFQPGSGCGREGQGRVRPVEADRRGRQGLG